MHILAVQGRKVFTTFIVTNANDCPNLLSHGATFRMGVLLPNYTEENVVKGETGTLSNVFPILQDLWLKQTRTSQPSTTATTCIATQLTPLTTYGSTSANQNTDTTCIATQPTPLTTYGYTSANQNSQNTGTPITSMYELSTVSRTMATPITSMYELSTVSRTMPANTTPSSRQPTSQIHQNSSHSEPPICCMHVHQPQSQVCKPGEPPALRKVNSTQWQDFYEQISIGKAGNITNFQLL